MRSKVLRVALFAGSATATLHLSAGPALAQVAPRFTIMDLGDFGGNRGVANAISDSSMAVGDARSAGQIQSAFRQQAWSFDSLNMSPWTGSSAKDVNAGGDIIGRYVVNGTQGAFLMNGFDWWPIGLSTTSGWGVTLTAINDNRVIVGSATIPNNNPPNPDPNIPRISSFIRAFVWRSNDGGSTYQETILPTFGGELSSATGVNIHGDIVGKSTVTPGLYYTDSTNDSKACVWTTSDGGATYQMTRLYPLPGGVRCSPEAISNGRIIVGSSTIDTNVNPLSHACMWTPNAGGTYDVRDLGVLPQGGDGTSSATAVNEFGYAVGRVGYCDPGGIPCRGHAVIWVPGTGPGTGIFDLNTLVDNMPAGYVLVSATDINNLGQITGEAVSRTNPTDTFAFRLDSVTPLVPPCGTSDFNGDNDYGTDADIEAFFACLAGSCCPTCFSGGSDFNSDGDVGTDADIEAFFRVLAGGTC